MISRRDTLKLGTAGMVSSLVSTMCSFESSLTTSAKPRDAVVGWQFDHGNIPFEDVRSDLIGKGILLRGPSRLMLVEGSTLQPIWDQEYNFQLFSIEKIQDIPSNRVGALALPSGSTYRLVDLDSGHLSQPFELGSGGLSWYVVKGTIISRRYHMQYGIFEVMDLKTYEPLWGGDGEWESGEWFALAEHGIAIAGKGQLTFHGLRSGEVLWSKDISTNYGIHVSNDRLIVLDEDSVTELDFSGSVRWTSSLPGNKQFVDLAGEVLTIEGDSLATGISSETGEIVWQIPVGEFEAPSVRIQDGWGNQIRSFTGGNTVTVHLRDGSSLAYQGETGKPLFHAQSHVSSETSNNFRLYHAQANSAVIDLRRGEIAIGSETFNQRPYLTASLSGDWLLIFYGDEIQSYNLNNGEENTFLGNAFRTHAVRNTLFVQSGDYVEVHDLSTGDRLEDIDLRSALYFGPIGELLIITDGESVYGFDLSSQKVNFKRQPDGKLIEAPLDRSPTFGFPDGSTVWAHLDDNDRITRISLWSSDGTDRWRLELEEPAKLIGYQSQLDTYAIWVRDQQRIYAIDGKNGEVAVNISRPGNNPNYSPLFRQSGLLVYDGLFTTMYEFLM